MTGTAATSAGELRKIYKVSVVPIPTNRPPIRERLPERIFGTEDDKCAAIVEEVAEMRATGRPVLIGTRSIDKSEKLSAMLTEAGVEHQVLNARQIATKPKSFPKPANSAGHRLDEHGRPRHRHPAGRGCRRTGRPARHLHRNARRRPRRSPTHRPLRPPRRSRLVSPVLGAGRRHSDLRPGPEAGAANGRNAAPPPPVRSTNWRRPSKKPNAASNAATSATARG